MVSVANQMFVTFGAVSNIHQFKLGEITSDHWSLDVLTPSELAELKAQLQETSFRQEAYETEVASLKRTLLNCMSKLGCRLKNKRDSHPRSKWLRLHPVVLHQQLVY